MVKGLVDIGYEHEPGEAGWKVMTLYTKIKIELLLKDESLDNMLTTTGLAYSTFSNLKRRRPSLRTYAVLAEYFGLDINELRKLPVHRDEVIGENKIENRKPSAYDVIEEAYFSQWFLTGYKDESEAKAKELRRQKEEAVNAIKESRAQFAEIKTTGTAGLLDKTGGSENAVEIESLEEEPNSTNVEEEVNSTNVENHGYHDEYGNYHQGGLHGNRDGGHNEEHY